MGTASSTLTSERASSTIPGVSGAVYIRPNATTDTCCKGGTIITGMSHAPQYRHCVGHWLCCHHSAMDSREVPGVQTHCGDRGDGLSWASATKEPIFSGQGGAVDAWVYLLVMATSEL